MKNLLIKLGLWEEVNPAPDINGVGTWVDKEWYEQAWKHFCDPCNRWFADTRGKLMHDRHRHKDA